MSRTPRSAVERHDGTLETLTYSDGDGTWTTVNLTTGTVLATGPSFLAAYTRKAA